MQVLGNSHPQLLQETGCSITRNNSFLQPLDQCVCVNEIKVTNRQTGRLSPPCMPGNKTIASSLRLRFKYTHSLHRLPQPVLVSWSTKRTPLINPDHWPRHAISSHSTCTCTGTCTCMQTAWSLSAAAGQYYLKDTQTIIFHSSLTQKINVFLYHQSSLISHFSLSLSSPS